MRILFTAIALFALAPTAQAQVWTPHSGLSVAEQHRLANARVRARSAQQEALARQNALEARLALLDLQAARQPAPAPEAPDQSLRSPAAEAQARAAATARRETSAAAVTQIDAWLDRAPQ